MVIGDDTKLAGWPIVPDNGENGRVRWGAREINRTRDYIAQTQGLIPTGKANFRSVSGISSGTAAPTGGADGDIYFQIIT